MAAKEGAFTAVLFACGMAMPSPTAVELISSLARMPFL